MHSSSNAAPTILVEDHSRRLLSLEETQKQILPLIGQMSEVLDTFKTVRDDIKEIKDEVKGISAAQAQSALDLVALTSKVSVLDEDRQSRLDRKKTIRNTLIGIGGTVIAAIIVYILKLK